MFPVAELRVSPTKECGKGSKRKQDDLEEDDEQEPVTWATWVNQELAEEEDSAVDPDYEVMTATQPKAMS